MELSESFRRNAANCLRRAQEAPTPEDQALWFGMAQHWLRLAQFVEEQRERPDVDDAADDPAPGDASAPRRSEPSD